MVTRKDICDYLHRCIKMRINSVFYREQCAKQEFRCIMDCIALIMIERGEY